MLVWNLIHISKGAHPVLCRTFLDHNMKRFATDVCDVGLQEKYLYYPAHIICALKKLPFHLLPFHGNVACDRCTIVFVVCTCKLQITSEVPWKERRNIIFIKSKSPEHILTRGIKYLSRLYCIGMSDWSHLL